MLTKDICEKIWHCHREIEAGHQLLEEVKKTIQENRRLRAEGNLEKGIKNAFGRDSQLELGVPTSQNAKRLFRLSYELAEPVIQAHIAKKQAELSEFNVIAKLQLAGEAHDPAPEASCCCGETEQAYQLCPIHGD